jgi:hypothetical protein
MLDRGVQPCYSALAVNMSSASLPLLLSAELNHSIVRHRVQNGIMKHVIQNAIPGHGVQNVNILRD